MRAALTALLVAHGLIHAMGLVKAFGWAELPQLSTPISRPLGVAWAVAGVLQLTTAAALWAWPRGWWGLGLLAVVASQAVIATAWADARFGTAANVLVAVAVVVGFLLEGPTSFRAAWTARAEEGLGRVAALPPAPPITEADLAPLPLPVQRYLRAAGFVGAPRTLTYFVRFRGRLRGGADEAWMPFVVTQRSFADEPTRLFLMDAGMFGLPVQALHVFREGTATFRVRVAGAVTIVDARGPDLDRAETVTLFNDMCLLAPATLLSPEVGWEPIDDRSALGVFSHRGQVVRATLTFGDDGMLTNFVSDDRLRASRDGTTFTPQRFSTPVLETRAYGRFRLAARAEARWHAPPPEGEFVYGEFETLEAVLGP